MSTPLAARTVIAWVSLVLVVSSGGCSRDEAPPPQPPPGSDRGAVDAVVVDCDQRISGGVIKEYPWREQSVIAGPVAFWPAKSEFPEIPSAGLRPVSIKDGERRFASDQLKLQIIIERGEHAVVAIAPDARELAAFLFRKKYRTGGYPIRWGTTALDVTGCREAASHTEYSTALIVDGPRCLPLVVEVDRAQSSIETFLPIGVKSCQAR